MADTAIVKPHGNDRASGVMSMRVAHTPVRLTRRLVNRPIYFFLFLCTRPDTVQRGLDDRRLLLLFHAADKTSDFLPHSQLFYRIRSRHY